MMVMVMVMMMITMSSRFPLAGLGGAGVGTDVNVCLELINVLYFEASTETTKLRTFPDATQHAATRAVGCSPH